MIEQQNEPTKTEQDKASLELSSLVDIAHEAMIYEATYHIDALRESTYIRLKRKIKNHTRNFNKNV